MLKKYDRITVVTSSVARNFLGRPGIDDNLCMFVLAFVCVRAYILMQNWKFEGWLTPPYPLAVPPVMIMTQENVVSTRNEVKCVGAPSMSEL